MRYYPFRISAILAIFLLASPSGRVCAGVPEFKSGNGIRVLSAVQFPGSGRTVVVNIETPLISKKAIRVGSHQVWITLPSDYSSNTSKRYPVLYLLHGGGDGWSGQWVSGEGKAEELTKDLDLITVMPEGGKAGWYTDWVRQFGTAQKWETFHTEQLIPWIDANLRTNASKKGRAIAGLSMGGYGALHYAYRHPEMFSYVGSFSGAANLQDPATQVTIIEQSLVNGLPPRGAFGPVRRIRSWRKHNPLKNAEKFRGLKIALYAGAGMNNLDIIELAMKHSTTRFHKALDKKGIEHDFVMYGRPGGDTGCNGGHNFGCWNFALKDMLPKMMAELSSSSGSFGSGKSMSRPGKDRPRLRKINPFR